MVKKILMILLSIIPVYSTALPPTANGSVQSSVLSINKPIEFSSAGCFDNDVQDYGATPYYAWDFDYDGTFNADYTTEEYLSLHSYSTCGHYRVALRYYDNDGQASELYILELDISIDSRFYYLKDHLGSIRVTIDEEGEIAGSDDYYPFGAQMPGRSVNIANPESHYKFSGKEYDEETGYSYFGARTYDGRIGRWLQVDPLADKYPGLSPYNYCVNNPVRLVDPDGRFTIKGGIFRFQTVERYNWYFLLKFIPGVRYIYNSDDYASKDPNRTVSGWDWIPFELLGIAEQYAKSAVLSGIVSNLNGINNGYALAGYDPTKSIGDQLIADYLVNARVWSNSKQSWIKAAEYIVIQSNGQVVYDELNLNPQYFIEMGVIKNEEKYIKDGKLTEQGDNKIREYLESEEVQRKARQM